MAAEVRSEEAVGWTEEGPHATRENATAETRRASRGVRVNMCVLQD
jgi:hypothetical protein